MKFEVWVKDPPVPEDAEPQWRKIFVSGMPEDALFLVGDPELSRGGVMLIVNELDQDAHALHFLETLKQLAEDLGGRFRVSFRMNRALVEVP